MSGYIIEARAKPLPWPPIWSFTWTRSSDTIGASIPKRSNLRVRTLVGGGLDGRLDCISVSLRISDRIPVAPGQAMGDHCAAFL
jgi:hypothetical protein